jgi:hypothetical protein
MPSRYDGRDAGDERQIDLGAVAPAVAVLVSSAAATATATYLNPNLALKGSR